MKSNIFKNRKGTALIVALLVMGVLMAISLALSALVLRESMITRDFLDAGQSYYAAESASEIGLYGVKNNLPGWEPGDGSVEIRIDKDYGSVAELVVRNKCKAYPCFDEEGYDLDGASGFEPEAEAFYATLGLNESATIPLFVVENGTPIPITGFAVEFYSGFQPGDLKISGDVSSWDVLRWKIVGLKDVGGKSITESISDFTAVSSTASIAGKGFTDAVNPSWFGTMACSDSLNENRLTDSIICNNYITQSNIDNCTQTQAREFYLYSGYGEDRKIDTSYLSSEDNTGAHCYNLSNFITDHQLNYLTLTNLINPAVLGGNGTSSIDDSKTKLFYRIELFTDKDGVKTATDAVREYADITADGYSGKSKQSVNVKIKRDSFMPVFNFSLYSTYQEKPEEWEGT